MVYINEDHDEELDKLRRKALAALTDVTKNRNFERWLVIGQYIETGRRWAMTMSRSNEPKGIRYNQALNVWFARNPHFENDIGKDERNSLMRVMENLPAIRHFLVGETPQRRRQLNHPTAVLRAWKHKEASLEKEANMRKAEQAREEALKADDGRALGVPDMSPTSAPRLPTSESFTVDLDEDPHYQAMAVRKAMTPESFREFARWAAQIAGLKLAEQAAPAPKAKKAKVAKQEKAAH